MHRMAIFAAVLLALLVWSAQAADSDPGVPEGYVLAFSDEFSEAGAPDASRWTLEEGAAAHNGEQAYYARENAWVEDGCLIIEARREEKGGMEYSSARLNTQAQFSFCYGRLEARIALPEGRGTWSALWLLPSDTRYGGWLASGEVDLMEHVGYDPGVVHSTIHTEKFNSVNDNAITHSVELEGAPGAFHDYVLMWDEAGIDCYVDGELLTSYHPKRRHLDDPRRWPFNVPFHIVMNLAIGGSWGGQQGIDGDAFPQRLRIDYIRVYTPENP